MNINLDTMSVVAIFELYRFK